MVYTEKLVISARPFLTCVPCETHGARSPAPSAAPPHPQAPCLSPAWPPSPAVAVLHGGTAEGIATGSELAGAQAGGHALALGVPEQP